VTGALDLARATPPAADPRIQAQIAQILWAVDDSVRGDARIGPAFREFAISRLAPVFANVGWVPRAGEPAPVAILRNQLIETLGGLGDPALVAEARRRYEASSDPTAIPGPVRKAILGVVARHADAATWERLLAAARAEKTPLVKDHLYALLSSTEDDALARRALDLALTAEPGVTNSAEMISRVGIEHPDLAFDFALAHIDTVNARLDATSSTRYYATLAGRSADPAMIGKLKAYAAAHVDEGSRRETETAAANITDRVRVRALVRPAVAAWLAAGNP
jgi:aminopeptidase N